MKKQHDKHYLDKSMPIFLKFINQEIMTNKELDIINFIRDEYSEYLNNMDISTDIDPLFYIYLGYCSTLVRTISDSENAKSTHEFIINICNSCEKDKTPSEFETLAEEAFNYINYHKINELYNNLMEYYQEEQYLDIETHKELLEQLTQENPEDINLKAQHNLLHLLLNLWGYAYSTTNILSLAHHVSKILEINKLFKELKAYPNLTPMLDKELDELWDQWFIEGYLILFFIPKLTATYNITFPEAELTIRNLLTTRNLSFDDNSMLVKIIQKLLINSINTCILKFAIHVNSHKHIKNSPDFIVRNIGNINLMELNIEIMLILLSHNKSSESLLILEKLDATIIEFMPYASSEWLIFCHRFIINLTPIEVRNEKQRAMFQVLIKISQTLESCYYKKNKGESIPAPPPQIYDLKLEENIRRPKQRSTFS